MTRTTQPPQEQKETQPNQQSTGRPPWSPTVDSDGRNDITHQSTLGMGYVNHPTQDELDIFRWGR